MHSPAQPAAGSFGGQQHRFQRHHASKQASKQGLTMACASCSCRRQGSSRRHTTSPSRTAPVFLNMGKALRAERTPCFHLRTARHRSRVAGKFGQIHCWAQRTHARGTCAPASPACGLPLPCPCLPCEQQAHLPPSPMNDPALQTRQPTHRCSVFLPLTMAVSSCGWNTGFSRISAQIWPLVPSGTPVLCASCTGGRGTRAASVWQQASTSCGADLAGTDARAVGQLGRAEKGAEWKMEGEWGKGVERREIGGRGQSRETGNKVCLHGARETGENRQTAQACCVATGMGQQSPPPSRGLQNVLPTCCSA